MRFRYVVHLGACKIARPNVVKKKCLRERIDIIFKKSVRSQKNFKTVFPRVKIILIDVKQLELSIM